MSNEGFRSSLLGRWLQQKTAISITEEHMKKKGAELAETIDIIGATAQPQQAIREMIRDVITSSHIFPSVRLKPEQMQKRQEKDSTSE